MFFTSVKMEGRPRLDKIDYEMLPEHCRGGMKRYIENHELPGGFLTAVLENDLFGAFSAADSININRLIDYAAFLYNEAPFACWGSREKVKAWLEEEADEG